MPRVEYRRIDLPLRISQETDGMVALQISTGRGVRSVALQANRLADDISPYELEELRWLFREVHLSAFVEDPARPEISETVYRIVLDIPEPVLTELNWETLLQSAASELRHPGMIAPHSWVIVRACSVRPSYANLPFTLPLRILQVNSGSNPPIADWVQPMFGSRPREVVERAVVTQTTSEWMPPETWATVDVLHVTLPTFEQPEQAFSAAKPDLPGTLGWFSRWTDRWQTRLLVIQCDTPTKAVVARRLGARLCNRGGPAVIVANVQNPPAYMWLFYQELYGYIVHDFAIDHAVERTSRPGITVSLYGGTGREEGLRVSTVGFGLFTLGRKVQEKPANVEAQEEYRALFPRPSASSDAQAVLTDVENDWKNFRFDLHEREGLLPISAHLEKLRTIRRPYRTTLEPVNPPAPRFVNSALWREINNEFAMIPQDSRPLAVGERCHLGIWLGPEELRIRTIDASAIIDEVFKWSPEMDGVWIEVAVVGIDFEVFGESVQELWLPREAPTEAVYFAIAPKRPGIAQLRFGIYYLNNLIQSFRLGARVWSDVGKTVGAGTGDLAAAIGVEQTSIGDACYIAGMEYARSHDLKAVSASSERALTIVANTLENRQILTVKGSDLCNTEVHSDAEMPNIVAQIRQTLDRIAFVKIAGLTAPQYQFLGKQEDIEARCKEAISKLASAGWNLFANLAPSEGLKGKIRALLSGNRKTIHVAQLLREKVIPWAFVYDRYYDNLRRATDGQPVEQGVCLAALAASSSEFDTLKCGEHKECLLNKDCQAERQQQGLPLYEESTVACPLHFWGFRHVIEVPPRQVVDAASKPHNERRTIKASDPLRLVAGLNATLALCNDHWKALNEVHKWETPQYNRDPILDLLRKIQPDLIYFFCHARGGQFDPEHTYPPYLEFQVVGGATEYLRPQDFAGEEWLHGPLVFLNACGTMGYSPDALSPFLKALVDGRDASGVLGTEVPVAEALATTFAHEFITRFIGGTPAGEAVLTARRMLLASKNPLGLVYTLFASADLVIEHDSGKGDSPNFDTDRNKPRTINPGEICKS